MNAVRDEAGPKRPSSLWRHFFFPFRPQRRPAVPGADAERPRKRNQHIHIGDAVPALQYGDETLAGFAVVSKLLLGQPRGIPVAPENHGHDVFCDFSPFIFHSPFVAFVFLLFE